MAPKALSPAQLEQFDRDGYVLIPAFLTPSELTDIRDHYRHAAACFSSVDRVTKNAAAWDADGAGQVLRKVPAPFDRDPRFREIFSSRRVLDHVEDLVGPDIYLHSSKLLFKPPRSGRRKPMHQDLAYWTDMSARQVTLWCAVDRAEGEQGGGIEVIPGSHKNLLQRHHDMGDFQLREDQLDMSQVRVLATEPGDALFLDVLTIHASAQNQSENGRLAAIVNYYSRPRTETQTSRYGSTTPLRRATPRSSE